MKRLGLRVPDSTMAALRRELASAREHLGQRYSLNDLCVRKLGSGATALHYQTGDGTLHVPRVPPPPPVPISPPWGTAHTVYPGREEPQPERQVRAKEPELVVVTEELAAEIASVVEEAEAVTRMADEGGPDGVG